MQPQTPPMSSSSQHKPECSDPEYVAIILAATQGARLFPLTSEYPDGMPKHLLPISPLNSTTNNNNNSNSSDKEEGVGGATLLQRLLIKTYNSGFEMVIIAINKEDDMTLPFLLGKNDDNNIGLCKLLSKENETLVSNVLQDDVVTDLEFHGSQSSINSSSSDGAQSSSKKGKSTSSSAQQQRWMHVRVVHLPDTCHGSADALRFLSKDHQINNITTNSDNEDQNDNESTKYQSYIPRTSHAVVMPGDLIMEGDLLTSSQANNSKQGYDGNDIFSLLVQEHRRWNACDNSDCSSSSSACTMLLTNVGAEDKEGVPLKESSKAKTGLLSREEEDMEYIGLSSEICPPLSGSLASSLSSSSHCLDPSRRVVLKRSKIEVEEDEGTGSTPKITVSKSRLHSTGSIKRTSSKGALAQILGGGLSMSSTATKDHSPTISLRTDLHDVHVYVISNWVVFDLLHARPAMQSFQNEVLPLLISRQYRGVEAAFGPTAWKVEENRERLHKVLKELDGEISGNNVVCDKVSKLLGMYASGKMSGGLGRFIPNDMEVDDHQLDSTTPKEADHVSSLLGPPAFPDTKHQFAVSAQVLSREASSLTLRACTLPSLLYGCSATTSSTLKLDPAVSSSIVASGSKLSTKFNSILMSGCTLGEKVQTKACTIGKNVVLGDRTKLNNVLVMDGVKIGSNVVLQNSIVGVGATIGDNCNLKDCQVGPGAVVAIGTKTTEKGESLL